MSETITVEFTIKEYAQIAEVAQKEGKTVEQYCQELVQWKADAILRNLVQDEKSRKFDQLVAEGMEPIYANYHAYGNILAVAVMPVEDYTLLVRFNNDELRRLDCSRYLSGTGAFLQNKAAFQQAQVDEYGTIYWGMDPYSDSGATGDYFDLCPHEIYELSEPI